MLSRDRHKPTRKVERALLIGPGWRCETAHPFATMRLRRSGLGMSICSSTAASSASIVNAVGGAGFHRKIAQDGQDVALASPACSIVARVKRRQLHRDSGDCLKPPFAAWLCVERVAIGLGIALRILQRSSRFAKHVEAVGQPLITLRPARRSASSIVRPKTKLRPRIFIASRTAVRTTGRLSDPRHGHAARQCRCDRWRLPAPCPSRREKCRGIDE